MPTPSPGVPRVISGRQLHMIARAVLLEDLTITSGEWRDRVYDRLIALGFRYPPPDHLTAAMNGVERHLAHKGKSRSFSDAARYSSTRSTGNLSEANSQQ